MASRAVSAGQRNRPFGFELGIVTICHWAWVGLVQSHVGSVDLVVDVAGLVSHDLEEVGTAVPAAETGKSPVGAHRGDGGVVGVEGVICSSLQVVRNSSTDEDREDPISILMNVAI